MDDRTYVIHEYDPVKRREYYLKTRDLKGLVPQPTVKTEPPRSAIAVKPEPNRQQRQEERRRKIEAQVDALKIRLKKLREVLAEQTKAAKARSGVRTPAKKSPAHEEGDKTAPKQTATQKADAAEKSKEYYEKNKDQILADEFKSLTAKIKTIQERIAKMRTETSSAGAKKIQNKK